MAPRTNPFKWIELTRELVSSSPAMLHGYKRQLIPPMAVVSLIVIAISYNNSLAGISEFLF
jgi:hypothetical protein